LSCRADFFVSPPDQVFLTRSVNPRDVRCPIILPVSHSVFVRPFASNSSRTFLSCDFRRVPSLRLTISVPSRVTPLASPCLSQHSELLPFQVSPLSSILLDSVTVSPVLFSIPFLHFPYSCLPSQSSVARSSSLLQTARCFPFSCCDRVPYESYALFGRLLSASKLYGLLRTCGLPNFVDSVLRVHATSSL